MSRQNKFSKHFDVLFWVHLKHSESPSIWYKVLVVGHSSWCEHVLRGPWRGGHWNHKAFYAPSGKLDQNLWVSHQDPRRGGLHHHLLRRHSWEPAAYWRILQVRSTQQHRWFSLCRVSIVGHTSVFSSQQLCRCRELHLSSGRWHSLKTVGSQLPHAGHPLEIKMCT